MTDRIEKVIELSAPVVRVWRALTDHKEFGTWFRVELDGPFVVGRISRGRTTYPGYEGMKWEAMIVAMEPLRPARSITSGIAKIPRATRTRSFALWRTVQGGTTISRSTRTKTRALAVAII